jgi:hypothetical protein
VLLWHRTKADISVSKVYTAPSKELILKMEAVCFSVTLVHTYQKTAWCEDVSSAPIRVLETLQVGAAELAKAVDTVSSGSSHHISRAGYMASIQND